MNFLNKVNEMMKLILILILMVSSANAATVTIPTTYATNGTVTSTNLNGNFSALANTVNGDIDNTNVNTTAGYRLPKTVSALPSAGTQGAVYFLTTDNTLNFDTGSSFIKSVTVSGTPAQGDTIYYSGTAWTRLAAGTSGYYLKTQGAGANPTWANATPSGIIVMWSGTVATIPTGWELSDGTCAITCPDLRNRFIVAADADSGGAAKSTVAGAAAQSGGSVTISTDNLPAHTHGLTMRNSNGAGSLVQESADSGGSGAQTTGSTGSGTAYTQPFYALAYIIKT